MLAATNRMNPILAALEETERRYPQNAAVRDSRMQWSYTKLLQIARRAGAFLLQNGVRNGQMVGILMERNATAIGVLYGVLYSGAGFVFIDTNQPVKRIRTILRAMYIRQVVADRFIAGPLVESGYTGRIFLSRELLQSRDSSLLAQKSSAAESDDSLCAYHPSSLGSMTSVVYGAEAVYAAARGYRDTIGLHSADRIGTLLPLHLYESIRDLFSACMTGAELILLDRKTMTDPATFFGRLGEQRITVLSWTHELFRCASAWKDFERYLPLDLRACVFCGEYVSNSVLEQWTRAGHISLFKLYGAPESVGSCLCLRLTKPLEEGERLPAGEPMTGREIALVDENYKKIEEPGHIGRLVIGGRILASGYLGLVQMERSRFVTMEGERAFLTGDTGYFHKDGKLYLAGRSDSLVLHMGCYVDLSEMDDLLGSISGVDQICCVYEETKGSLIAYFIGKITPHLLKANARDRLPEYMIPDRLLRIPAFPMNEDGSIDREMLKTHIREKLANTRQMSEISRDSEEDDPDDL